MEINGDLRELKGYLEGERCLFSAGMGSDLNRIIYE
jgi:hypothetical protein